MEKAQVVFAGYGIETKNYSDYLMPNYNDIKGDKNPLDVKNKIVIIFKLSLII